MRPFSYVLVQHPFHATFHSDAINKRLRHKEMGHSSDVTYHISHTAVSNNSNRSHNSLVPETKHTHTDFVHSDQTEWQEKWGEVEEKKRSGVQALLTVAALYPRNTLQSS